MIDKIELLLSPQNGYVYLGHVNDLYENEVQELMEWTDKHILTNLK